MTASAVRVLRVGERALLVELGGGQETEAFHAELLRRRKDGTLPAVREIVPAARTVLLDGVADPERLAAEMTGWRPGPPHARVGEAVGIPVRYDGPDLPEVAERWGVSVEAAVRIHTAAEFRVAFCGFAPGFGYLTGLDERYEVPRLSTPRTAVPAGSVALAGPYTGVYPRSSPGGWQLIGTTDVVLWDTGREPAALLAPGTRVRFTDAGLPGQGRPVRDSGAEGGR
ncbi:5-oxoprolinase subunit B family protein [Streptomyces sp. P9-A4]|uniref:5-oxoprolinase subunit B family protein n=1 Tax=Streptomyces sp. P9-A4 TaxID=3072285 RepID=UPI002FC9FA23